MGKKWGFVSRRKVGRGKKANAQKERRHRYREVLEVIENILIAVCEKLDSPASHPELNISSSTSTAVESPDCSFSIRSEMLAKLPEEFPKELPEELPKELPEELPGELFLNMEYERYSSLQVFGTHEKIASRFYFIFIELDTL